MAGVGGKTDATAQLPDEVLGHVFSFLSLKDKLRSEAVNYKFLRCVHQELKANPQPLEYNIYEHKLNGYPVSPDGILGAVQTLAKKAKFISVSLLFWDMPYRVVQHLDSVLSILISDAQCLSKVTSFVADSGCSQAVLENFLGGCEKLSTMKLCFYVHPPNTVSHGKSFPLDLPHLLKNKQLTELHLCPILYPIQGLAEMFQQIQPDTLRKLDLIFDNEMCIAPKPVLSLHELFDALLPNGSVLEHVNLDLREVDVRFAPLFDSLARLPALSKCDIYCDSLERSSQVAQFVPAVTSLFNMSHVDISVALDEFSLEDVGGFPSGCQFVTMIRRVQRVHPSMAVEIYPLHSLTLSLGNASIYIYWHLEGIPQCGDDDCAVCCTFYASFLSLLRSRAQTAARDSLATQHLPNWQVDRCKLDKVVDDLNNWTFDNTGGQNPNLWRALALEENAQQQSITINFETKIERHLFTITVSCGQCLANGCVKCVN